MLTSQTLRDWWRGECSIKVTWGAGVDRESSWWRRWATEPHRWAAKRGLKIRDQVWAQRHGSHSLNEASWGDDTNSLTFHRHRNELDGAGEPQEPGYLVIPGHPEVKGMQPEENRARGQITPVVSHGQCEGCECHPLLWCAGTWGLDFNSRSQKTRVLIQAVSSWFPLGPLSPTSTPHSHPLQ